MSLTLNERRYQDWKFNTEPAKCDKCGQVIIWMKDEFGRNVPVNIFRVTVAKLTTEKKRIVDVNGVIHDQTSKVKVTGWQIHWDSCSAQLTVNNKQ